jgi:hypothetical protein
MALVGVTQLAAARPIEGNDQQASEAGKIPMAERAARRAVARR